MQFNNVFGVRRQINTNVKKWKRRSIIQIQSSNFSSTSLRRLETFENPFPLPSSNNATPYEIFHLPKTCSSAEIKSRYYDLVKIYHPDRALAVSAPSATTSSDDSQSQQKAHDNFKKVRDAYTLLSNKTRRRMYDNSGYGWDLMNPSGGGGGMNDFQGPAWKGGFPRNAAEWAAYDAWSASFRRSSGTAGNRNGWQFRGGSGHDKFGWQTYAGSNQNPNSNWFYGYGHAFTNQANPKPMYTSNARFFVSLTSLTAVLAIFQYARLHQERQMIRGGIEDKRHQTAVQSLAEARKFARSEVGMARMEEMRKRAKEVNGPPLLQIEEGQPDWQGVIGRGGPSGKKAYEERLKRLEAAAENQ